MRSPTTAFLLLATGLAVSQACTFASAGPPAGPQPPVTFRPALEQQASTSLGIYDEKGRLVRTLWQAETKRPDEEATWDGLDNDGKQVPAGSYSYRALQLPAGGIQPRYIATVGNGRGDDPENLGGVVGLIPFDVKTDSQENIYLAGTAHGRSLQKFDRDGNRIWISERPDPGRIDDQTSALAVGTDYVYVAGPINLWRVDINTGMAVAWPGGSFGQKIGTPPPFKLIEIDRFADTQTLWVDSLYRGVFWWPAALAGIDGWQKPFHSNAKHEGSPVPVRTRGMALLGNELFLSLALEDEIAVHDRETGKQIRSFGFPGPAGIVADSESNELIVVGKEAIYRCDPQGENLRKIVPAGLSMPWGLARDAGKGKLYVTDQFHDGSTGHKIKVFDESTGELIEAFGADDSLDGPIVENELFAPAGIDIDPTGRVLVTENLLYRLSVFRPDWTRDLLIEGGAYLEAAFADPEHPELVYGIDGWFMGAIREYRLDYDERTWKQTQFWYHGGPHPTRDMTGGAMYGSRIVRVDGVRYLANSMDTLRIYRIDENRLRLVTVIGHRYLVKNASGEYERRSVMSIWIDHNGDEVATLDEVSYPGDDVLALPHVDLGVNYFDIDCEPDGTVYWGSFKLPLRGSLPNGALEYHWDDLAHFPTPFDSEPVEGSIISTDGDVQNDDRYLALMTIDNDRKQPGVGTWHKRTKTVFLRKHAGSGEMMWQVGSKANEALKPGELYHPSGIETIRVGRDERIYVLVNEESGPVQIWSGDGLFVGRVLRDMSQDLGEGSDHHKHWLEAHWLSDPYASVPFEGWHFSVLVHPVTRKVYLYTQAHEGGEHMRVYEIQGLDGVIRSERSL